VLEDRYRRAEEGSGDWPGPPLHWLWASLLHKGNVSSDLSAVVAVAGAQEDGSWGGIMFQANFESLLCSTGRSSVGSIYFRVAGAICQYD
jgi:hypothetical protein